MLKEVVISKHATIAAEGKLNNRKTKSVYCISTGRTYTSVTDTSKATGIASSEISRACNGKRKHANGLRFCFVSEISQHLSEVSSEMQALKRKADMYDEQERARNARRELEEKLAAEKRNSDRIEQDIAKKQATLLRVRQNIAAYETELSNLQLGTNGSDSHFPQSAVQ